VSSKGATGTIPPEEHRALAQLRPQAHDRKARIGFIGAGWWATTNHMPVLQTRHDVELVSVCSLDPALNERIRHDFGFSHATTDYRELLAQGLDGVVVASPHSLHAEHAIAALEAGCHVMVEKPMTTKGVEARRLVQLARKNQLQILVPYGWHYRPLSAKAREVMARGVLGKIEFVVGHIGSPTKNLFTATSFDWSTGAYTTANLSTWADPALSHGGYGQGQLTHLIALVIWLTDLEATSVNASMERAGASVDLYDTLSVHFKSGAVGAFSGAATVPSDMSHQLDLRIYGTSGMLLFDIERPRLEVHSHAGGHQVMPVVADDGAYRCDEPPHQFVELILGLTNQNNAPGEVALRAVEIIDAAYRSEQSGQREIVGEHSI